LQAVVHRLNSVAGFAELALSSVGGFAEPALSLCSSFSHERIE